MQRLTLNSLASFLHSGDNLFNKLLKWQSDTTQQLCLSTGDTQNLIFSLVAKKNKLKKIRIASLYTLIYLHYKMHNNNNIPDKIFLI